MKRCDIQMRDPYVLPLPAEERYLLFGSTDRNVWHGPGTGFDCYSSTDLENWDGPIPAFRPPPGFWSNTQFWAPECHPWQGRYYLFASFARDERQRGTQVLVAERPEGPYRLHSDGPVTPRDWECLDGTLFADDDGRPWMVFCHEWVQVGDGEICAMRLTDDLRASAGAPELLFRASDAAWARPFEHKGRTACRVTDGPFCHRLSDGKLLMLWSTTGFEGYAMGYALSESGGIQGPWRQSSAPVYARDGGHGMLFRTFDDRLMMTFHHPNETPSERPDWLEVVESDSGLALKGRVQQCETGAPAVAGRPAPPAAPGDGPCAFSAPGNPLLPGRGLTDPHITIHDGRAYLFATHDHSPENRGFVMKDWWVWSSQDLVRWKHESTLKPETTYLGKPFDDCWATFGAYREGAWYWYLSCGPTEIGVVTADSPAGPWRDPLGRPLVPKGLTPTEQRDPDILLDDDGEAYIVFGTFEYYIARLSEDMISLAEKPRRVHIARPFGPYGAGRTDDKPSLHKRNGIYYLSWSSFYAMSDSVYGPYAFKGSVIDPRLVAPQFQCDHLHHDRHGNFFTWNGQWYYAFNDKSRTGCHTHFRDSCLSYVHYRDNGELAPVRLDRVGVGQYDAASPRIEAEDFFGASGAEKRECPFGGFEMRGLRDGSSLVYPNVRGAAGRSRLALRLAAYANEAVTIEVREGRPDGPLLGCCAAPPTGGWDRYQTVTCELAPVRECFDMCLLVKGGPGELLRFDWFRLT